MTNIQALYLFLGAIGLAIIIGQSAYLSTTGGVIDGLEILIQETVTRLAGWVGDGSLWLFNTVWFLETMKNVLQAALFAGAALVGLFAKDASEAQTIANKATVYGFVIFGFMMAMATKRVEFLRAIETIPVKD